MLINSQLNNIPVVILAGGLGTRIADVKNRIPKALVKIGKYPVIYHIIKNFKYFGIKKFIICTGFKGNEIKKYFKNNLNNQTFKDLDITFVYSGVNSNTGERIKKVKNKIKDIFFLTYCDGLTDLNFKKLLNAYLRRDKIGIMTVINPQSRFGIVSINKKGSVYNFDEKKTLKNLWVNAGFYIFNREIFKLIQGKNPIFESETLKKISKEKKLSSFKHRGFWKCMDTIKDKNELNKLWKENRSPWKNW